MKSETKQLMADKIRDFRLPRFEEIPNVGFYLDQTTKYINSYLEPLGCLEVTSSMFSNYVKKGLVPNPVKKLYYREHIAYFVFITIAKSFATMDNIRLLIDMQQRSYTLPVAYDYVCMELENMLFYTFGLKDSVESLGETESMEKDMLRSLVFSAATVVHMHACFEAIREEMNNEKRDNA